ncbi:MAG: hypothetical protein PHG74_04105 [Kiritimatiellae bacterium]|nr:hypothetical protein [Kiritimatiellia bacterium]MDD3583185.1 hypothetical protein [Kiritimatiellia bacterium]
MLAVCATVCCALVVWKWDFLMMAKEVVCNRMAKRRTVEERVEQYGTVVRERLLPFFEKAGVPWPARRLTLVGLKEERQLEVWGEDATGTLKLIRVYPVLGASGTIGPKLVEGDGQVPEGIYGIESLNPNSAFHLSLRVSYPNAFDLERAEEDGRHRPGSDIMIHGGTASAGCLAMGDETAEDLFVMAALTGPANVEVILSPCDLRVKQFLPPANAPVWTARLYQALETKMKALPPALKSSQHPPKKP